jgi:hypothetical protein
VKRALIGLCTVTVCLITGCTDADRARRVLESEGYEDIVVGGYSFFGCTESADFANEFYASRNGRLVEGAVCCTFFTCEVRLAE